MAVRICGVAGGVTLVLSTDDRFFQQDMTPDEARRVAVLLWEAARPRRCDCTLDQLVDGVR